MATCLGRERDGRARDFSKVGADRRQELILSSERVSKQEERSRVVV